MEIQHGELLGANLCPTFDTETTLATAAAAVVATATAAATASSRIIPRQFQQEIAPQGLVRSDGVCHCDVLGQMLCGALLSTLWALIVCGVIDDIVEMLLYAQRTECMTTHSDKLWIVWHVATYGTEQGFFQYRHLLCHTMLWPI
jgi:hypothetical protein